MDETTFHSEARHVGNLDFPSFAGTRIMMMPVVLGDAESIPDQLSQWRDAYIKLCALAPFKTGVAYLTIDEQTVPAGRSHRRPGIHVDGIGPDGRSAAYGGGGGYAAPTGMLLASTHIGCRAWLQTFKGWPRPNGDCSHLTNQCSWMSEILMQPGWVYWCGPMTVHEGISMKHDTRRQLVRLSGPSDAPWHEGYTKNPLGIMPTGPIHGARPASFMRGES